MTEKFIIDYVVRWLKSNIDEPPPEGVAEDSANLLEKIEEFRESIEERADGQAMNAVGD